MRNVHMLNIVLDKHTHFLVKLHAEVCFVKFSIYSCLPVEGD